MRIPQEAGNVPYVTEGGFGVYTPSPRRIADTVADLLGDAVQLRAMGDRARLLSRPQATREIAMDMASVLLDKTRC